MAIADIAAILPLCSANGNVQAQCKAGVQRTRLSQKEGYFLKLFVIGSDIGHVKHLVREQKAENLAACVYGLHLRGTLTQCDESTLTKL